MRRLLAGAAAACLLACGGGPEPITHCEAERGIRPVCGFKNPEDLALLPDRTLLVSQMGSMDGSRPGSIAVFDPDSEQLRVLYPGSGASPDVSAGAAWGDPDCPGPAAAEIAPHGLDLAQRPDAALQLLVVNHGGRESVEMFEVGSGAPVSLAWRGCVVIEDALTNDVAALPGGGFVVTKMLPSGGAASLWYSLRAATGGDTGAVLEWTSAGGLREIPGTRGSMPNGVSVSPDGRYLFVNYYLGSEVRRVARDGSETPLSAQVTWPDNSTWGDDGRLLVASHVGPIGDWLGCNGIESGSCPLAFEIVAVDPETMATEVVFQNAGAPMGAGTTALERDGELFIGSYAGDRLIRTARRSPAGRAD